MKIVLGILAAIILLEIGNRAFGIPPHSVISALLWIVMPQSLPPACGSCG
jgi:hypothetical protein